ncbi:unnamed protein product [Lathyrus oleraceus]
MRVEFTTEKYTCLRPLCVRHTTASTNTFVAAIHPTSGDDIVAEKHTCVKLPCYLHTTVFTTRFAAAHANRHK